MLYRYYLNVYNFSEVRNVTLQNNVEFDLDAAIISENTGGK